MSRATISDAIHYLEDLLKALTNAYWEANEIQRKDCVFNMVTTLFAELNELSKLSIEDHCMTYEPVTSEFHSSLSNIRLIHNNIEHWFPRTITAKALQSSIPPVIALHEFI